MIYKKYQRIKLEDLFGKERTDLLRSELASISESERQKMVSLVKREIIATCREKFPDIPKNLLRTRYLRILRKEFDCTYSYLRKYA